MHSSILSEGVLKEMCLEVTESYLMDTSARLGW